MTHFITDDIDNGASNVFAGLAPAPSKHSDDRARRLTKQRARLHRSVMNTVPVLLVGSLAAVTFNLTGPVEPVNAKTPNDPRLSTERANKPSAALAAPRVSEAPATEIQPAPATYRVAEGDTVSDIASKYGLSTASVLALNGLSWSSMIFPGQELKLSKNTAETLPSVNQVKTTNGEYTIVAGDTISGIAHKFGVSTISVMSANGLGWSSIIYPGQTMIIPGNLSSPLQETEAYDFTADELDAAEDHHDVSPDEIATGEAEASSSDESAPRPTPGTPYVVVSGDTISAIASIADISAAALLEANGIADSGMIFIGDTLTIPAPSSSVASTGDTVTYLDSEMQANADVIIQVGRELGVSDYGIVIALATAMQESSLRNLDWGDRDSVGLFQQRPSAGWGTVAELTAPDHAARLFYGGPSNPNSGTTRGLLEISGWQNMTVTRAAQAVQISGHPDAYAKWEKSARFWLEQLD
ncbi:LysM peptidoglycan-binding domain-containing protein [Salinibacterium sp. SWN1162]|uniref:muramidase family protein n=1 Tax=Salinibacterium sp. SWN1162 TaxID=2792053 RepID=UPI0018CF06F5|nr:LysM peptidoglycan-binding domain-containing protein [Salinibacterium sp. SWN1162]MBH0009483.1 LysM peptidoglycan-binding domain-containing protein [Salinibacterium sp. SWN1162]